MMKTKVDALFVTNADVPIDIVSSLFEGRDVRSAIFVSTHAYYPDEREKIEALVKDRVDFFSFADFLDRQELNGIDEQARHELDAAAMRPRSYIAAYESRVSAIKNELVREKVEQAYNFEALFCANGLGVEQSLWASPNMKPIPAAQDDRKNGFPRRVLNRAARFRRLSLYRDSQYSYLIMGTVRRIGLTQPAHFSINLPVVLDLLVIPLLWALGSLRSVRICCSIHDPHRLAGFVFVDGYHPSNYPYSYLGSYDKATVFLVSTALAGQWFQRHGFEVEIAHELLHPPLFREIEVEEQTRKSVLLLLNHAGDWGAIINRSDTDKLVMAFCNVARRLPETEFVIRPHPTSIHPKHEGRSAITRLRGFVEWLSCSNVTMSGATLDEDISGAGLCISEYSLTLINCYERGVPGLIANLSGRQSLMEDYQSFGFAYVDSEDAMFTAISDFVKRPDTFTGNQNRASRTHNANLLEPAHSC